MFDPDLQISDADPALWRAMRAELQRQEDHVELIASENYWPAAGFDDSLLRCGTKPEVVHGNETAVQPGVQA